MLHSLWVTTASLASSFKCHTYFKERDNVKPEEPYLFRSNAQQYIRNGAFVHISGAKEARFVDSLAQWFVVRIACWNLIAEA